MPETRRVPESMPHGSYTSPNGIHDTAGKAAPRTESGRDVAKAGGDVRHSMQPNMSCADGPGHAGTPEAPKSTRMSQGKTQELQGRAAAGTAQRAEQSKKGTVQGTDTVAPRMLHGKPSGDAKNTPASTGGGQKSQQPPSGETRFSQRPVRQPVPATAVQERTSAQQTAIHMLTEQHAPAGTAPIRFGQARDTEPRPGRNTLRVGTAPSTQARQHDSARQEPRTVGDGSARPMRGAVSVQHPGPAGNGANSREKAQSRPIAGARMSMPKTARTGGLSKPSVTEAMKGAGKKEKDLMPSRKQRGKKHEGT